MESHMHACVQSMFNVGQLLINSDDDSIVLHNIIIYF